MQSEARALRLPAYSSADHQAVVQIRAFTKYLVILYVRVRNLFSYENEREAEKIAE